MSKVDGENKRLIMNEIVIKRNRENFNRIDFKVIVENGPAIPIGNGEVKRIMLPDLPAKMYVRQGWLKSKVVTLDGQTSEIVIRSEKFKSRLAPAMGGLLILVMLLPKYILSDSQSATTITAIGLCFMLIWVVYAFIIKRNEWISVDKKDG